MATGSSELLAPRVARQAGAEARDHKQRDREVACDPEHPPGRRPPPAAREQFPLCECVPLLRSFSVLFVPPFVNVTVDSGTLRGDGRAEISLDEASRWVEVGAARRTWPD